MSKETIEFETYLEALNAQHLFDSNAFLSMQMLLRAEIQDLQLSLEKMSEEEPFDEQLFKDVHYTLVTKMKTLHLIRELAEEYEREL